MTPTPTAIRTLALERMDTIRKQITAAAGEAGAIVFRYWSGADQRYRYKLGYVGEELEAYHWYDLDEVGAWRKLAPVAAELLPPRVRAALRRGEG